MSGVRLTFVAVVNKSPGQDQILALTRGRGQTWYHGVQVLEVFAGHAGLRAHFVHKPADELDDLVRDVVTVAVKVVLCVVAVTAADTTATKSDRTNQTRKNKKNTLGDDTMRVTSIPL